MMFIKEKCRAKEATELGKDPSYKDQAWDIKELTTVKWRNVYRVFQIKIIMHNFLNFFAYFK